ncbi:MAG: VTT domain-containing protein [Candidatus Sericytochromatia bacterium]|nr:VTT domain-containing protein [Candidatus Sericytochromatia bacterium]
MSPALRLRFKGLLLMLGLALGLSLILGLCLQLLLWLAPADWRQAIDTWRALPLAVQGAQLQSLAETQPLLPLYFLGLQVLQVMLAPIPGQLMGLLGGWLFGFWGGLSLSLLGLALGSLLVMLAGRWLGRHLLPLFLKPVQQVRFANLLESGGYFSFLMIFLLPALPDDAICLLAGMTRLNLGTLLLVCVLGRLPGMGVLSWAGARFSSSIGWPEQMLLVTLGLLSLGLWLAQDSIEAAWHRRQPVTDAAKGKTAQASAQTRDIIQRG